MYLCSCLHVTISLQVPLEFSFCMNGARAHSSVEMISGIMDNCNMDHSDLVVYGQDIAVFSWLSILCYFGNISPYNCLILTVSASFYISKRV